MWLTGPLQKGAPITPPLLLMMLLLARNLVQVHTQENKQGGTETGGKKFGDRCVSSDECGFEGSFCSSGKCLCLPESSVTNHIDKCGTAAKVNEPCFFNEQCEASTPQTECKDGICTCRFEKKTIIKPDGTVECVETGGKKFGDRCVSSDECGFEGSFCSSGKCLCLPESSITNHIDKCGTAAKVNESCFFNEQCEASTPQTECRDAICTCRFEKQPIIKPDGTAECVVIKDSYEPPKYVDPAMIGILVGMFLMFISICAILRLFSRARWRENRTIFNTPNPRLMNVSLLRESKLLHQERRGSRTSAKSPSRQESMASLRAHSPNSQGSRRGSRGSSNASAASTRSNKSPPQNTTSNSATVPMLESVTVEIQQPSK